MPLETDEKGHITLRPLTGYETHVVAGSACLLRIEFARSPAELTGGGGSVQLAMTPLQAAELATALQALATRALQTPAKGSA